MDYSSESYCRTVYYITLYKALTVESVDEIISFCRESLVLLLFKSKPLRRTFLWCCFFFMLCEVVLTFESADEILSCGQLLLCISAQFALSHNKTHLTGDGLFMLYNCD